MVKSRRNLLVLILSVVFAFTLISFVAARPVSADTSAVTMKETASVRIDPDGRNGIRFSAYVSDSVTLDEDTFAGIIVAKGDVEAPVITDDVIDVKAERFDPVNNDAVLGKAFNAVIWDIAEHNANAQELTARAYVCDNGEYSYSENVCVRSLAQVASKVIISDDPTPEDLIILNGYVDGANAVVSVGDSAFEEDVYAMDVEVMKHESIAISINPSNIVPIIETDSTAISVENGVIKGLELSENEVVTVTLGNKQYVINVKVVPFEDKVMKPGVLADFDEEGYADYVENVEGGTLTMLPGQKAIDENIGATSGVFKYKATSYDKVNVFFQKSIKFSEIDLLYIRLKTNVVSTSGNSELRYNFLNADGSLVSDALLQLPNSIVDKWTLVTIPVSALSSFDQNQEIFGIYLYWIAATTYVDEIGFVKGSWVDSTVANSDIVADFNEENYIFNVNSGNGSGVPGVPEILLGEDATAVGATSGVVALTSMSNWNYFNIKVQKPFKLGDIDSITLKVKYSNVANLRIGMYDAEGLDLRPYTVGEGGTVTYTKSFSEGGGVPKIATILDKTSFGTTYASLKDNEWVTITIPSYLLTAVYESNREVAVIRLYNNVGSTQSLYVDEISISTIPVVEKGALVAENYDDNSVIGKVYIIASSVTYPVEYFTGSLGALQGASSGVVSCTYSGYFNIHTEITPTYSLGDVGGIYIRMKHSNTTQNIGQMRLYIYDEDGGTIIAGKYFREIDGTKYPDALTTDWVTVEIPLAKLSSLGAVTTTKIGKIVINSISAGTICVDEIGFLPKA